MGRLGTLWEQEEATLVSHYPVSRVPVPGYWKMTSFCFYACPVSTAPSLGQNDMLAAM